MSGFFVCENLGRHAPFDISHRLVTVKPVLLMPVAIPSTSGAILCSSSYKACISGNDLVYQGKRFLRWPFKN